MPALPVEMDAAAIEHAILTLARSAASFGSRTPASDYSYPANVSTPIGHLIAMPLPQAMLRAEYELLHHLANVVGPVEADKVRQRVNEILHREFDEPRIRALGPTQ